MFGELDAYRAGKISEYLKEVGQAFITLTDFADFSFLKKDDKGFDNKIRKRKHCLCLTDLKALKMFLTVIPH
ncbi:MAG: hypothetical protein MZV64_56560 [Ignavibacteriales bacterium]|nr:hypothetical protein [Ignavibacteriales bacterium]